MAWPRRGEFCYFALHAVPWTRRTDSRRGGCGDLIAEREFPSAKVYRRDDRGIVRVESFGLQCDHHRGLRLVVIHHTAGGAWWGCDASKVRSQDTGPLGRESR